MELQEEQVLWFRARRGHLAGQGAPDPGAAARATVGVQAQQEAPALLGISQRTASRPSAAELATALRTGPRELVRTWGQRDTLHIFDAAEDWALIVAARAQWAPGGRRGVMPSEADLAAGRRALRGAPEPFTKELLHRAVTRAYVDAVAEQAESLRMDPIRFAAGRVLWQLAHRGDLCIAGKVGAERTYAAREAWFPELSWRAEADPAEAATRLTRRYLAAYGPATAADLAHFFGARVREAGGWLAALEGELVPVRCGSRRGLLALSADADELRASPPGGADWPLRLLPLWDGLLMGHKDKSWTVPEESECKLIWRRGAYVAASVQDRGRIVATWTHRARRSSLRVELTPLSGWRRRHMAALVREARSVAAHLGLEGAEVELTHSH
ncbi:MAG: winged helix DNA-binding domain-containing protein [Planctomycetota bacterium]|nr:winged helix DNA-binding domain-containing protein [Planctomycetota bacterium]